MSRWRERELKQNKGNTVFLCNAAVLESDLNSTSLAGSFFGIEDLGFRFTQKEAGLV